MALNRKRLVAIGLSNGSYGLDNEKLKNRVFCGIQFEYNGQKYR